MATLATSYSVSQSAASSTTRYQVLVGALMIQLILGTIYGYSIFWEPLEKAVWPPVVTSAEAAQITAAGSTVPSDAVIVEDAAAARREQAKRQGYLKYAFAICVLAFATTMIFAGRLQDVVGPRLTALVGGFIMAVGFLIAGQMNHRVTFLVCHGLLMGAVVVVLLLLFHAVAERLDRTRYPVLQYIPHGIVTVVVTLGILLGRDYVSDGARDRIFLLWATIGLLAGVGIGFAYVCPIAALVKWFPQNKGLVAGIAVAGFGFGAYIFSHRSMVGATGFIREYGISALFNIHALICLVTIGIGAMLLRNPPPSDAPSAGAKVAAASASDLTWQQTLRTVRFYLVWLMFFSGSMAGLMVIGIMKPFAGGQLVSAAQDAGQALSQAMRDDLMLKGAAAVGILSIFNAVGRIFWGLVSDRLGRTISMVVMFGLQGVTLLALGGMKTEWMLAVGAASVGFNYGGCFALFPSLTADLFGSRNIGANYGWVFTSYGIAGVLGTQAGNMAYMATGSYFAAFALAAALCFLSAVLAVVMRGMIRKPT